MSVIRSELRALWQRRRAFTVALAAALMGAWLLALPMTLLVAASGVAHYPDADARLLEPGSLLLLELLRTSVDSLGRARAQIEMLCLVLIVFTPLALTAWCVSAPDERCSGRSSWWAHALHRYPVTLAISAAIWLFRAVLLLLGAFIATWLRAHLDRPDERVADLAAALTLLGAIVLVGLTPPLRDLAVVHAARRNVGVLASLRVGCSILVEDWRPLFGRQALLCGALAGFALLGLFAPPWFWLGSRNLGSSLALLLLGPTAVALCLAFRLACLDQARRSHTRLERQRVA